MLHLILFNKMKKLFSTILLSACLLTIGSMTSCSSDADRVEKYVEKANKSTPVDYGEHLFLTKVSTEGNFVVYNVEYRGKNDSLTLAIFDETRDEFARLYVDRLDNETKKLFSNANYGVRVVVRDTMATRSVTMDVRPEEIK